MQLPREVRTKVEELAEEVGFGELKRGAAALSEAYREGRPPVLASATQAAAYAATRMPATYAAAEAVLREIKLRLGDQEIASVLDVGAGTGAAALAAQECFAPSRITLLERTPAMAAVARTFLPEADIRMDDFARPESFPPHDLVIAAYALGETGALDALPRLWRAARVALVVIEPGSPAGFAFVREVRSRLMGDGGHMVAPCPTEGPCPVGEGDWCHFAARVERTGLHRRLKNAELNYEDEKFSYVAVARDTVTPAPGRIVRRPVHQPGLIVLETCTTRGIETVQARKRDRDVFRAARRAGWGEAWEQKND